MAKAIVTPTRISPSLMEDNVTIRPKGTARALSFSPNDSSRMVRDEHIIGALSDIDLVSQQEEGMMDCEIQEDDLLEDDLMEMEAGHLTYSLAESPRRAALDTLKRPKTMKTSSKENVPLGIQNSKQSSSVGISSKTIRLPFLGRSDKHSRLSHNAAKKAISSSSKGDCTPSMKTISWNCRGIGKYLTV